MGEKNWNEQVLDLFNFQAARASIIIAVKLINAKKRASMLLTVFGVSTMVPVGSASPLAAPLEKLIDTVDELVDPEEDEVAVAWVLLVREPLD